MTREQRATMASIPRPTMAPHLLAARRRELMREQDERPPLWQACKPARIPPAPGERNEESNGEDTAARPLTPKQERTVARLRGAVAVATAADPEVRGKPVTFGTINRAIQRHAGLKSRDLILATTQGLQLKSPADFFRLYCADLVTIASRGKVGNSQEALVSACREEKKGRERGDNKRRRVDVPSIGGDGGVKEDLQLPYPWALVEGDNGPFYFNDHSGEAQWERPVAEVSGDEELLLSDGDRAHVGPDSGFDGSGLEEVEDMEEQLAQQPLAEQALAEQQPSKQPPNIVMLADRRTRKLDIKAGMVFPCVGISNSGESVKVVVEPKRRGSTGCSKELALNFWDEGYSWGWASAEDQARGKLLVSRRHGKGKGKGNCQGIGATF
eukprot:TRINITY_DN67966_c0_g1_i1.p1 TRINITY_DN67966_c0_g1~~TRINITY_DN67966_c0_g1_i1.p1  ORF type:complete len:384 (+),score=90.98 TRINITY_DN67966_c0_g1_i1:56-1207(+)